MQLVEIKAVEAGYPFYGRLVTSPAAPLETLIGERRALVHSALLTRLGLAVGDTLRIGEIAFRIAGLVESEPDRAVAAQHPQARRRVRPQRIRGLAPALWRCPGPGRPLPEL